MREWWQRQKRNNSIRRLRKELEWWGFPTDQLSDEDIENGLREFALVINKIGVTTKAFSEQLKKMASMYGAFNIAESLRELGEYMKTKDPKHYMNAMQYTMEATKTKVIVNMGKGVVTHPKEFSEQLIKGLEEAKQEGLLIELKTKEEDNEVQGSTGPSSEDEV